MMIREVRLDDWAENRHIFHLAHEVTEEQYWSALEPYYGELTDIEYELGVLDVNSWPAQGYEGWSTDTDTREEFDMIVARIESILKRSGLTT